MTEAASRGDLSGLTCLVTGSSHGIGRAVARSLAERRARVMLHGRDREALKQTFESLPGEGHTWIAADLADGDGFGALIGEVNRTFNGLDVLIHNAGVLGPRVPLEEYSVEEWERVIRVNLTVPFLLTRELVPALKKGRAPSVIFVSSGAGVTGKANWGAYAVSKFGVEGLTQVWADELRDLGIRVNAVDPGATRTRMRARAYPDEDPQTLPTPEQITPIFLRLASPRFHETGRRFRARDFIEP